MEIINKTKLEKGFHFIAINQKNNTVYVSNNGSNSVFEIDEQNFKILRKLRIKQPRQVVFNPKNNQVLIVSRNVGSKDKLSWFKYIPFSDSGGELFLVDCSSHKIISKQEGAINSIDLNVENNLVYCSSGYSKEVFVLNCKDLSAIRKIPLGTLSKGIYFDSSSKALFVAHPSSDLVSVIDSKIEKITFRFKVPGATKVMVNPKSNCAFVLERLWNFGDARANEFDTIYSVNLKTMEITNQYPKRNKIKEFFWATKPGYSNFSINPDSQKVYYIHEKIGSLLIFNNNLEIIDKVKIPKVKYPHINVNSKTKKIFLASGGRTNNFLYVLQES